MTEDKMEKKKGMNISPWQLFSFADSLDSVLMFVGAIAGIGNGLCMPLMAVIFGGLIDSIGKNGSTPVVVHGVSKVSLKFVYVAMGAGVASFFQVACWMVTGERQAARIRSFYLETILRQDIGFFDKNVSTGEVVGRMSGDTVLIQDAIGEKVGKFIQYAASSTGGFVVALFNGWLLTLVMLSSIPPLVISGAVMTKLISKLASQKQAAHSFAETIVEQTIGSIRTVASFTGEQEAISNYNKSLVKAYKSCIQEGLANGLVLGMSVFIIFSAYGFAVWFGAKMILEKGYTGGDVMSVIFGVVIGSMSLGQASPCLSAFAAGQAAASKMFEAINRKPEIDVYDVSGLKLNDIRGDIELRDVEFSYPSRPDELILNGLCLLIPSGTTVALVGKSGSGKSTLIGLIERFYDPQAGEVLIDGVNLKDFQLKWIREKISIVSQEPVLFTSSIRDNIAYGKTNATNEEIEAAAELANASSFIKNLPQGLDTNVGEHGIQLSGGQKQRVAIARAIIKDPRILLLDEATSALDAESERIVQEALDRVMINQTTVIVSHCLSTVRNADTIVVIWQGKIVEKGSHSELLKIPDGEYNRLISLQETSQESEQSADIYSGNSHLSPVTLKISICEEAKMLFDSPTSGTAKIPSDVPLRRLAYLNSREIPALMLGTIGAVANGIIIPIFGVMLAGMVKTLYEPKDELKRESKFWALMFVFLGAASLLTSTLSMYFFSIAGYKLINRIRSMCFEKLVYMEIGWFDEIEHSSGAISARLSSDAASVRGMVGDTLSLLVQNTATAVAGLAIAFEANWKMALFILALFPLIGISGYIQLKSMKGFSTNAKEMYEEASLVASDAVSSIRTIASFGAEEKVMKLYQKKCEGPVKAGIVQGMISGIGFGLSFFLFFLVYAVTFYVGAKQVNESKATFTEVFRVFFVLSMTAIGISQTSFFVTDATNAKISAASVFGIIDQVSKIDSSDNTGMVFENVVGEVQFQHISFNYPTRPHIEVLRDLCLTIPSGKIVTLVGESGSGKSTVVSLLQRFYDPNSGLITLDGVDIQKLQLKWLRQQMGLVSQEPALFNDTIRANIAYGKEGATEGEIIAAAELANAHRFISSLQQGYDTSVGERGVQLSGGQKQRVAIARALVKTPKILLLDEATSALDLDSERVVQDALERVMVNRTIVVVAHRLSTIKNADLIAVIKNGIIAEKGNHETLINVKNGNMSNEKGLDGEINTEQVTASISHPPEVESQEIPVRTDNYQEDSDRRNEKEENTKTLPYYKLFSFADSTDILLIALGTIAAVGNGMSVPLMTIFVGDLVNAFGENAHMKKVLDEVSKVSLNFLFLALGAGAAGFIQVTCWIITGERQAAQIRNLYLKTILRQDIAFFDKETHTGEIIERVSGDTILIQDAMGEKVGKLIQLLATFIGGIVIAFVKGWLLTLVMLSSIPALVIAGAFMSIFIAKMASQEQTAYSLAATVSEQTIGAIKIVASFTGEKQAITKYNESLNKAYKSGVQEGLASGLGFGTVTFIAFSSYALAFWFGGKMILKGYNGGDVINVIFAVMTGSMSLGQASPSISAIAAGKAAAYKLFEAIGRKPQIDAYDTNGLKVDDIRGNIELLDVYFSYPSRPHEQIFNGFSLFIPSGTTAALVGQSGSGKSTVISLIERFYDPQAGEVLIDGINLKDFQLKWIRQKIGLVSQEPVLFTSSIKDNIAYGKNGATVEEIRSAAELANAEKFIDNLPQGLDTMVGEHGTQLSGGQKQRVAIARAILKDPKILLLDEATSALDAESERVVQEALEKIMINRTTIIVAHRLSTVRNSDMICVIHQGKIAEKGIHSELTKDPDGAYSQLIRLQEMSIVSEQNVATDQDKPDIRVDSGRHTSQRFSLLRSISRSSSGTGNSSRHSFTVPFGVPTEITVPETTSAEPYTSASEPSQPPSKVPLRRLAFLNKPEIPVLLLGTIAAVITGVTLPTIGILLSSAIKSFFEPPDELRKDTKFWALMYFFLALTCLLSQPLRSYFFAVAGCKLIKRIRSMCFEKVVYMEVSWFDEPEHSSGAIGARLSTDSASVRSMVGDALSLLVQNIATLFASIIISFEANWQLALIVLALVPLVGVNGYFHVKFVQGFSADSKKMYEEASQVVNDAVGSIRTVASFCAEEKVMELYQKKCEGPLKAGIKQGLIGGVAFGVSCFLLYCVYASSFYAGARFVEAGITTFAEVFRVFYTLTLSATVISQSSSLAPDVSKVLSAVASVFAILDRKSKIDASDESGTTIENFRGEIEFQHISFMYPTRPDVQIFKDLCLAIRFGKTVALVGESGSGKSTIISLLQRFYDPDSGRITLDGVEIQKLQLKWLRKQMGLVSQEPLLFNDTIRANIAYGKELGNATEAEILAAAELANAHKFISGLKQGYDTMVGERGIQLSGGQKQRVAIARAMVKAPKILLLDEATSALDAESERVVQDALDRVMVGRTTVMVAHRLSTIKGADLIAVVKNGVIAEKGKHETLVNLEDGIYASLVALQTTASSQ